MPEMWARLFLAYGPYGFLVLVSLIFLPKTRRDFLEETRADKKRTTKRVYIANWCAIFVLIAVGVAIWLRSNVVDEAIIRGTLEGLRPSADFKSRFDDLYLRRVDKTPNQAFRWLIISQQKLPAGKLVAFTLDQSTDNHEDITRCELPIKDEFYQRDVALKYDPNGLSEDGIPLKCAPELIAENSSVNPVSGRFQFRLIPAAFAQAPAQKTDLDLGAMSERLEANDALVRLQARSDLAAAGANGISYIQEVLTNPKSSYRLRLGSLVALNNMKADNSGLAPEANCAIVRAAAGGDDATLREQAKKYLAKHSKLPLPVGCARQALVPDKVPVLPTRFKNAQTVYIADSDSFDLSLPFEERHAVAALEESIRKWGGLRVVRDVTFADLVLKVECSPSEDTLLVYDAHFWPSEIWVWRMSLKNGLQSKEAPLAAYLEKAFEDVTVQ